MAAGDSIELESAPPPPAIELRAINKRFGDVVANRDVSMSVAPGTIHGIIGENGAGKSTLMSILYGFYAADRGEIWIAGRRLEIRSTHDAIRAGIGMVFQHFMLIDSFTVLENVVLGAEGALLLERVMATARARLAHIEAEYGLEVDVDALIGDLSVGLQQRVEILKALYRGAQVLILDEPTGVLTPQEAEQLFRILRALRDQGVSVVLISHKLREIMAVTETVSVMRAGAMVAHLRTAETSEEQLAELMVGRKVLLRANETSDRIGEPVLEVEGLSVLGARGLTCVDNVSLRVCAGEIVGIAGVSGNGQSELLEALSGIRPIARGRVNICGHAVDAAHPCDPHAMRARHAAHVPEDRLRMGLVRDFSASESFLLGYHDQARYNGALLMNSAAIGEDCSAGMHRFDVRPPAPFLKTASFSGGNQQKIVLAREMGQEPELLLVGQPTRGVDIGAIEFIHARLVAMRDQGKAILLVSVELEEIMALSDRIVVMFEGRIVGEMPAAKANERALGLMMANITPAELGSEGSGSR